MNTGKDEKPKEPKEDKPKEQPKEQPKEEASKISDVMAKAHAAAERLRIENDRMEANTRRLEEMKAFEMLGGKSEGAPQEKEPEPISDTEYAEKALKGEV
jgi:hypothetical protein